MVMGMPASVFGEETVMKGKECVILLHGLARTSLSMRRMEKALQKAGYMTCNMGYPSRKYPIKYLAETYVARGIDGCRRKMSENGVKELQKIHFVTHSMGGILVRQYLARHGIEKLGRVVMLAPPNHGSEIVDRLGDIWWYRQFNGPGGCSLGTDADSIPNTLGPADFSVGIITGNRSLDPVFSRMVAPPNDGKVSVASAKLEDMQDFLVVPHGHTFVMNKKEVIRQTIFFLQHGRFTGRVVAGK
jgi:pimeloyl-ACP methyl ester carboxylesterase